MEYNYEETELDDATLEAVAGGDRESDDDANQLGNDIGSGLRNAYDYVAGFFHGLAGC